MERDRTDAPGASGASESAVLALPGRRPAGVLRRLAAAVPAGLGPAWRVTWTSRLLVWAAGLGALAIFGRAGQYRAFDPQGLTAPFGSVGNLLVGPAARWDSVWYLAIAHGGYTGGAREAFFPLYPVLARAFGTVLGGSALIGGIAVSLVATVAALGALRALTEIELGAGAGRWAAIGLALSPMAFFLSAVYTESLFLALTVGAVLAARRDRWGWAATLATLSAATRSSGVLVLVALAGLALTARPRPPLRRLAPLALVPVGLGAFLAALWLAGLDPLGPFHVEQLWYRSFAGPFGGVVDGARAAWDGVRQLASGQRAHVYFAAAGGDPMYVARQNLMLFGFLVAGAIALAGAARRLPWTYALYGLVALAEPLSYPVAPQPLMSLPRYELAIFPLWMWWGWWLARHRRARGPALALSAGLLVLFTGLFATWHWVA